MVENKKNLVPLVCGALVPLLCVGLMGENIVLKRENVSLQKENVSLKDEKDILNSYSNNLEEQINSYFKAQISALEVNNIELANTNKALSLQVGALQDVRNLDNIDYIVSLKKSNPIQFTKSMKKIFERSGITYNNIHNVISKSDFEVLAKVVEAEIGGGNFSQKVNVANVIINRYYSKYYPNTWNGVLFQKHQFTPATNGAYKRKTASSETKYAIEYAFMFGDTTNGSLYFHSGNEVDWSKDKERRFVKNDGTHKFYQKVKDGKIVKTERR